jgi:hypothetical protein
MPAEERLTMSIYPSPESVATGKPGSAKEKFNRQRFRLQRQVHRDPRLSGAALRVAFVLIEYCNFDKGYAFPRQDQLAKLTGMAERSVRRAVAEVLRLKIFSLRTRGRRGRASEYVPNFDAYPDEIQDQGVLQSEENTGPTSPDNGTNESCNRPEYRTKTRTHNLSLPRSDNVGVRIRPAARAARLEGSPPAAGSEPASLDSEFEAFWAAYPRQEGYPRAKKQFLARRAEGVPLATLVAKAEQLGRAYADKPERIPWPATWLSLDDDKGYGWLNNPPPPRQKESKQPKQPKRERAARKAKSKAVVADKIDDEEEGYNPKFLQSKFPKDMLVRHRTRGYRGNIYGWSNNGVHVGWPLKLDGMGVRTEPCDPDDLLIEADQISLNTHEVWSGAIVWHWERGTCGEVIERRWAPHPERGVIFEVRWPKPDGSGYSTEVCRPEELSLYNPSGDDAS